MQSISETAFWVCQVFIKQVSVITALWVMLGPKLRSKYPLKRLELLRLQPNSAAMELPRRNMHRHKRARGAGNDFAEKKFLSRLDCFWPSLPLLPPYPSTFSPPPKSSRQAQPSILSSSRVKHLSPFYSLFDSVSNRFVYQIHTALICKLLEPNIYSTRWIYLFGQGVERVRQVNDMLNFEHTPADGSEP